MNESDKPSVDGLCALAKARERAYLAWRTGRGEDDPTDELFDAYQAAKNELRAYAERLAEPVWCGCGDGIVPNTGAKCWVCASLVADDAERLAALAGPLEQPQEPESINSNLAQASGVCDLQTALPEGPLDAENQWLGDMMILQVLADSEHVNEQEREVLTRWMESSPLPPGESAGSARSDKPAASPESSVSVPKEQHGKR